MNQMKAKRLSVNGLLLFNGLCLALLFLFYNRSSAQVRDNRFVKENEQEQPSAAPVGEET